MRETVETKNAPTPIGPYSQAVCTQGLIFVSGQIALDPATGTVIEGDIGAQTRQVLKNLGAILDAAGSGLDKVIKTTVFLTNLDHFPQCNQVYGEYLGDVKPARSTVQVARLPKEALVEIDAIALA
jgi:2-iminobutanoate/2-iminopropanoate deaminase